MSKELKPCPFRIHGERTAEEIAEITGLPLKTVYNYIPRNVTG